MSRPAKQMFLIVGLLSAVLAMGTVGYHFVEGWSWFDSYYMALTSLTTVGYEELYPLTHNGRIFTSVLLIVGVTVVFTAIGIMGDLVIQLELGNHFGRRRTLRMLENISNHYIVCGAGRVGRGVIAELEQSGAKVVLVDSSPDRAAWAEARGIPTVIADASAHQTLLQAGIKDALGLVAAIGTDAENVYVTLSARVLNPHLRIAARASNDQAEEKLRRAGASTVFTPYTFIGHRLAQALLRPHVLSFLDVTSAFRGSSHLEIDIEQIRVSEKTFCAGKTIEQSGLRQKFGVILLAIMRAGGDMEFNPSGTSLIEPGNVLIAMGERSMLKRMEEEVED
ncbi:MAG: NAD-binding protein [Acidobacteria bacterium]|nr:NAD-binding protein [Acidobacteriota bacterium]